MTNIHIEKALEIIEDIPEAKAAYDSKGSWDNLIQDEGWVFIHLVSNYVALWDGERYHKYMQSRRLRIVKGVLETCVSRKLMGEDEDEDWEIEDSKALDDPEYEQWFRQYDDQACERSMLDYYRSIHESGDDYLNALMVLKQEVETWIFSIAWDLKQKKAIFVYGRKNYTNQFNIADELPQHVRDFLPLTEDGPQMILPQSMHEGDYDRLLNHPDWKQQKEEDQYFSNQHLYFEAEILRIFTPEERLREAKETLDRIFKNATPLACAGCANYHGETYGEVRLICGMHPYGVEADKCPDYKASGA